ncbi:hypothetical protein BD779DRAFT_785281 [Infundibulicybe gibba]|nr:hypothetical protein BD779DRAFT_1081270 [Infundibulicybe gibba]KAF8884390.1 hypothetical protein BD779DRAFT_785281 [Infundibulicybe gibba]
MYSVAARPPSPTDYTIDAGKLPYSFIQRSPLIALSMLNDTCLSLTSIERIQWLITSHQHQCCRTRHPRHTLQTPR